MDCCLSSFTGLSSTHPKSLPFPAKNTLPPSSCSWLSFSSLSFGNFPPRLYYAVPCSRRRPSVAVVAANGSQCEEYSGLNAPLKPRSSAGSYLSHVLLDDQEFFLVAAKDQLEKLADDRREAVKRMNLSSGSGEAFLHRRIAELRETECQTAVEDVMYMLICYRFSGIRVHMVPQISKCIYNNRLEILPSKDWELESIHSFEVLQMIREHLTALVGWKANSPVTAEWATTQVSRFQLCGVYTASVLYGYLIKSASVRLRLEGLSQINVDVGTRSPAVSQLCSLGGSKGIGLGHAISTKPASAGEASSHNQANKKEKENLKCYLMSFDPETLEMCAKPKSKEAVRLIERHACALFGDDETLLESNEVISTSFASLKRFVLEAIAFGSFLWDAEEYVKAVYELEEN